MKLPGKIIPLTLRQLVSKPATVQYPAGAERQFPDVRGKIVHDTKLCIGCTACIRDCPSFAIDIVRISETERKFRAFINTAACTFCSQCVVGCPKSALQFTPEFELATLSRESMIYGSELPPEVAEAESLEGAAEGTAGSCCGGNCGGGSVKAPASTPAEDEPVA